MGQKQWFYIRADLDSSAEVYRISQSLKISVPETVYSLYQVAAWFKTHTKDGTLELHSGDLQFLDIIARNKGIVNELVRIGWIKINGNYATLLGYSRRGGSNQRVAISHRIRKAVLTDGKCAYCQSTRDLTVDHVIPTSRGGPNRIGNLQSLCWPCNRKKDTMTMDEFVARMEAEQS